MWLPRGASSGHASKERRLSVTLRPCPNFIDQYKPKVTRLKGSANWEMEGKAPEGMTPQKGDQLARQDAASKYIKQLRGQ